jgi:hypothetical protein
MPTPAELVDSATLPAIDRMDDTSSASRLIAPGEVSSMPLEAARVRLVMMLTVTEPVAVTPCDAPMVAATDTMSLSLSACADTPLPPCTVWPVPRNSASVSESTVEIATAAPKPALPP